MGTNTSNRSLERGLAILNSFKPGVSVLSHRDIMDSTSLPKATVTRLIGTLCEQGYLVSNHQGPGYCLGAPILSLARALTFDNELVAVVSPVVYRVAAELRVLVGFGAVHGSDVVFLAGVNRDETRRNRRVGPGMRLPVLSTAIGLACMAGPAPAERERQITRLSRTLPTWRPGMRGLIDRAVREIRDQGYCQVAYDGGKNAAIAAPVVFRGGAVYAFTVGYAVSGNVSADVPQPLIAALAELTSCIPQAEHPKASSTGLGAR